MTRPDAKRILDFWEGFDRVWPLPDPWLQTAITCQQLSQGHSLVMASAGQKWDAKTYEHFMPDRWTRPQPAPAQTVEAQVEAIDKAFAGW